MTEQIDETPIQEVVPASDPTIQMPPIDVAPSEAAPVVDTAPETAVEVEPVLDAASPWFTPPAEAPATIDPPPTVEAEAPPAPKPPRSIGWALKQASNGAKIRRTVWPVHNYVVFVLGSPHGRVLEQGDHLLLRTLHVDSHWLADSEDMLSMDWEVVE